MDPAVALVQAYLKANGYFVVTEVPVLAQLPEGGYRSLTDLDILAVRFPGARALIPGAEDVDDRELAVDPALDPIDDRIDFIIGEVKEGSASFNRTTSSPDVLRVALTRFGAIPDSNIDSIVEKLIHRGEVLSPSGPRIRLVAFGAHRDERSRGKFTTITLGHITGRLEDIARRNWSYVKAAQFKDPALGLFLVLEKARRSRGGSAHN